MYSIVTTKSYSSPPICEKEILRYAGFKGHDDTINDLLAQCIAETQGKLIYKVCSIVLPVHIESDLCSFGLFSLNSKKLAKNLSGCEKAIIFAATIGVEIDRLIGRYSRISPSKALMFQAIGAERIEALCDLFCDEISSELNVNTKPRFSPGYGDLALDAQRQIFTVLDCKRKIGLTLNDSLLMSPSKSVTAIMGLCGKA